MQIDVGNIMNGMSFAGTSHASHWTLAIAAITIGCVLARPKGLPEAVYAGGGALVLLFCGLETWQQGLSAISKGTDVYLFLAGMMLLSEIARTQGVFDWCARHAVNHSCGSTRRLFWLLYGVEVVVTVFLSNDATAVVMTPAVLAAVKAAKIERPLPYLLSCAFVANAASFVLPISNPANIVLFESHPPALWQWLEMFLIPSLVSIGLTALLLFAVTRRQLVGEVVAAQAIPPLGSSGKFALGGIMFAGMVLVTASAIHVDLGMPTLAVALLALALVAKQNKRVLWEIPKDVPWSVLLMVAGLFVVVEAVNLAGVLEFGRRALASLSQLEPWKRDLVGAYSITGISNVINNLPSGLITGAVIHQVSPPAGLRTALLLGVDLGPNVSVTGSLATVLWLIALRREKQEVSAWKFLKIGLPITFVALTATVLAATLTHK